jgi:hypothetical protein
MQVEEEKEGKKYMKESEVSEESSPSNQIFY